MDWKSYRKFLDEKIADAKHNLDHAAKDYLETKAKYEMVLIEKESFEKALVEVLNRS